jgi:hypothetical protein
MILERARLPQKREWLRFRGAWAFARTHPTIRLQTAQFEALIQFFLGRYRVDMSYDDSLLSIAANNLTSVGGFWCASASGPGWVCRK